MAGEVNLIAKIIPKNDAFTGLVDAKQVIGGTDNKIPDEAISASSVLQHLASGLTSDHSALSGLDHDDHPQYHNGTLPYTGDLNLGSHNITNVGTINNIDPTYTYRNITLEPMRFTVNPSTGTEPAIGTVYRTQAAVDAHGAFASISGVVGVLPNEIAHTVTIAVASGVWPIAPINGLGDYSRFAWNPGDSYIVSGIAPTIRLTSADGNVIVPGTTQMACVSSGAAEVLRLASAPSFADNAYRRYYVRIVSGTGVGQIKAIRNHSGTTFNVAARFSPSPDSSSIAEIVQPAAELTCNSNAAMVVSLGGSWFTPTNTVLPPEGTGQAANVCIDAIDITTTHSTGRGMTWCGGVISFRGGMRTKGWKHHIAAASVYLEDAILDGKGYSLSSGLIMISGGFLRAVTSWRSWILGNIGGSTSRAVYCRGGNSANALTTLNSVAYLFEGSIDDVPIGVEALGTGACFKYSTSRLYSDNISVCGLKASDGGRLEVDRTRIVDADALGHDAPTQFIIDTENLSASTILAAPEYTVVGKYGSVIDGH